MVICENGELSVTSSHLDPSLRSLRSAYHDGECCTYRRLVGRRSWRTKKEEEEVEEKQVGISLLTYIKIGPLGLLWSMHMFGAFLVYAKSKRDFSGKILIYLLRLSKLYYRSRFLYFF